MGDEWWWELVINGQNMIICQNHALCVMHICLSLVRLCAKFRWNLTRPGIRSCFWKLLFKRVNFLSSALRFLFQILPRIFGQWMRWSAPIDSLPGEHFHWQRGHYIIYVWRGEEIWLSACQIHGLVASLSKAPNIAGSPEPKASWKLMETVYF